MKLVGITGSHRTGKTSLKELIIERLPYSYSEIDFSIGQVLSRVGIDSSRMDYDFDTRKGIQIHLFNTLEQELKRRASFVQLARMQHSVGIIDRTPIDLAAYATIVKPEGQEETDWINQYITKCIGLTNDYLSHLVHCPVFAGFVSDPKSAGESSQSYIAEVIMGILLNPALKVPVTYLKHTNLEQRYAEFIGNTYERI